MKYTKPQLDAAVAEHLKWLLADIDGETAGTRANLTRGELASAQLAPFSGPTATSGRSQKTRRRCCGGTMTTFDFDYAMLPIVEHLVHRDMMNANLHTTPVRFSMLTVRAARILFSYGSTRDEFAAMAGAKPGTGQAHYLSTHSVNGFRELWRVLAEEFNAGHVESPGWLFDAVEAPE